MTALAITFDAAAHEYRVEGHKTIGVTTALKVAGVAPDSSWYTEESRFRGRCVHEATANLDLGVPHGCRHVAHHGYIESYQRWTEIIDHDWERIEEPDYSDDYGIAGMADRVGSVKGHPALVDLKTGGIQRWHPLQFALYDLIYNDLPPRVRHRIGLYLTKDGRVARMLRFQDPSDYDRALLAVRKAAA
jgi:hypothetical protein